MALASCSIDAAPVGAARDGLRHGPHTRRRNESQRRLPAHDRSPPTHVPEPRAVAGAHSSADSRTARAVRGRNAPCLGATRRSEHRARNAGRRIHGHGGGDARFRRRPDAAITCGGARRSAHREQTRGSGAPATGCTIGGGRHPIGRGAGLDCCRGRTATCPWSRARRSRRRGPGGLRTRIAGTSSRCATGAAGHRRGPPSGTARRPKIRLTDGVGDPPGAARRPPSGTRVAVARDARTRHLPSRPRLASTTIRGGIRRRRIPRNAR